MHTTTVFACENGRLVFVGRGFEGEVLVAVLYTVGVGNGAVTTFAMEG